MYLRACLAALALLLLGSSAFAAEENGQRAVWNAVQTLIDAWHEGNAAKAASVLHEDFRIESWQAAVEGRRRLFRQTRAQALADFANIKPGSWDVRVQRKRVSVDPNGLAHVWAQYVFYFDGKLAHCGTESYELFRTEQIWKIFSFADTDTPLRGRTVAEVCPG